jgi:diguanylate cyclase (GGDEF)-like protein/PAS domain S-box-containing protein
MARSLRYWLTVGLTALIGLSILTVVGVLLTVLVPRLNMEVEIDNRNIGGGIARQVDGFLGDAEGQVRALTREFLAARDLESEQIRLQLDTLVNAVEPMQAVYLVDASNAVVDVGLKIDRRARRADQLALDFSNRPFVVRARESGSTVWSDTYLSARGRIVVAVAIPWRRPADSGVGETWALVGEFDLVHLSLVLDKLGKTTGTLPVIIDRRGFVIAHPDPGKALRQESLSHIDLIHAARSGTTGTGLFVLDRVEYIGSTLAVPTTGWTVVVAQTAHEAYAVVRSVMRSLLVGSLLALGLVLLTAMIYGRQLTRRVAEFADHAKAVAQGDYNAPLPRSRAAELESLADSMRKMAQAVLDREGRLQQSEARFRDVANASADWIWEVDAEGRYTYASDTVRSLLGYAPEELIGKTAFDLMPPEDAPRIQQAFAEVAALGNEFRDLENVVLDSLGRRHITLTSGTPIRDAAGRFVGYRGVDRDVTAARHAEAQQRLAASVFTASTEGICVTDADACILSANPALVAMSGYPVEEIVGQTPRLFSSGHHDADFYRAMWSEIERNGSWRGEVWNRRKGGEIFPEWLSITAVRDGEGRVANYIGIFSDITERKQAEESIVFLAHHDPLTRLPNRALLDDRIRQSIAKSRRNGKRAAVLFLDLDRFKLINDTLGHDVGDNLLGVVADRLCKVLRETETVARLGGDEFVIVAPDVDEVERVAVIAQKVVDAMTAPMEVGEHVLHVTTSIGISIYPDDGEDAPALLRNADTAMYHAKESGRNNFQFFTAAMNTAVQERVGIENDLRDALENDEFRVFYQPQVDSRTGDVTGMEALIRWQHPQHGMVPPDRFIPVAEETGMIVGIGRWVLLEACRQAKRWHDAGWMLRIGVNLSARQFQRADLHAQVLEVLDETGLPPSFLELELTESMLMADPEAASHLLQQLAGLGIRLAIDDFGTGYSSLAYLKRFPVSRLKIDRSFVRDLSSDNNDAAIVNAVVAMASSLQMEVIAEGVETEEQLRYLSQQGCHNVQGYYFSRPRPASELADIRFDVPIQT